MHRRSLSKIVVLVLLSAPYAGCTKHANGITGPAGPAGAAGANGATVNPSPITGFVDLFNEYGSPDSSSSGVTIATLKGDSLVSATTDSSGRFSLPPLPPGNYDVHITKPGFDSLKVFVQHSGGDEAKFIGAVRMEGHVSARITGETFSLTKDVFNDELLIVNISFSGLPSAFPHSRYFNFYFSRSKNITTGNYDVFAQSSNPNSGTNQYQFQYPLETIPGSGFNYSPGDTVYVKTVVAPVLNFQTSWFDYATYRSVTYPYLGDSAVNSFIWPN